MVEKREFLLFGIDKYEEVVDEILSHLNTCEYEFDLRLILTEGITNAFIHGNNKDSMKPIYLRYYYDGVKIRFEFRDCGAIHRKIHVPKQLSDSTILDEHGRGLFVLGCIAEHIEFADGTLIVEKVINRPKNKE